MLIERQLGVKFAAATNVVKAVKKEKMKEVRFFILLSASVVFFASGARANIFVYYRIDTEVNRAPISPYIYGTNKNALSAIVTDKATSEAEGARTLNLRIDSPML